VFRGHGVQLERPNTQGPVALGQKTPVATVCRVFGSYVEYTAKWGLTSLSAGAVIKSGL
jgi:hypothetical protein